MRPSLTTRHAMRFDLKVPFAEKDAAKKLGARWDAANKLWYVMDKADLTPFAKWSPTPRDPAAPSAPPTARSTTRAAGAHASSGGAPVVGSRYVEQPRVCECLPWESCDKCESMTLSV